MTMMVVLLFLLLVPTRLAVAFVSSGVSLVETTHLLRAAAVAHQPPDEPTGVRRPARRRSNVLNSQGDMPCLVKQENQQATTKPRRMFLKPSIRDVTHFSSASSSWVTSHSVDDDVPHAVRPRPLKRKNTIASYNNTTTARSYLTPTIRHVNPLVRRSTWIARDKAATRSLSCYSDDVCRQTRVAATAKNKTIPVISPSIRDINKQSSVSQDWVTSRLASQDVPRFVSRAHGDHSGPLYSNRTTVPLKTRHYQTPAFVTPSDGYKIKPSSVSQDWVTSRLDEHHVPRLVSRHFRDNDLASCSSSVKSTKFASNKKKRQIRPNPKVLMGSSVVNDNDWVTSRWNTANVPQLVSQHVSGNLFPSDFNDETNRQDENRPIYLAPSNKNVIDKSCMGDDWVTSQLDEKDVPLVVSRHMGKGNVPTVVKDGAVKLASTAKNDDEPILLTPSNKDVIDKSCMGDDWVTSQLDEKNVPLVVSRHMGKGNVRAVVKDVALKLASPAKNDDEPIVLTPSNKDVIDKSCMGDDWVTSQLDEKDVPLVVSRHMGKGNFPSVVKDGALKFAAKEDDSQLSKDAAKSGVETADDELNKSFYVQRTSAL
jgi:hypothetical protein